MVRAPWSSSQAAVRVPVPARRAVAPRTAPGNVTPEHVFGMPVQVCRRTRSSPPVDRRGPVRVLGVDPGLTRCGIGVVDGTPGRPPTMVAVGVLRTEAGTPTALRLETLRDDLTAWVLSLIHI